MSARDARKAVSELRRTLPDVVTLRDVGRMRFREKLEKLNAANGCATGVPHFLCPSVPDFAGNDKKYKGC